MNESPPLAAAVWAGGRSVADPRISPDGTRVAFVSGVDGKADIALVSLEGQSSDDGGASECEQWLPCVPRVRSVSASGGGIISWLPTGEGIVYVGDDSRIHLLDLNNYSTRALTEELTSISTIEVSPGGDFVSYVVDVQDLFVVSTEPGRTQSVRVSSGADFVLDPSWSPDGKWLTWHEWDDPHMPWQASRIAVRRADASEPIIVVAGGANDVGVQQPRFSPDGARLAFISDATGWSNLWCVDAPSFANARVVVDEQHEAAGPSWGPGQRSYCWLGDGMHIAYAVNVAGWGQLRQVNVDDGRVVRELENASYTGLSSVRDAIVGVATSPTVASHIAYRRVDQGRSRVLARGPVVGLERAGREPELVEWESKDGTIIHGRLYRADSPTESPPPMLVWIHGGPTGQSAATLFARFGYFVQRGWSILVPDYRGSSGWGREFLQALDGRWGEVDVIDVVYGIRAAIDNGWADARRVVPFGSSAGGFTTLLLLADHPDLCAAGVAECPVSNLADFGSTTWRFEAHYLDSLVGQLPSAIDRYRDRSPVTKAASITGPLLVLHGDGDIVVPVEHSAVLVNEVLRGGGIVDYHVYEGEGHGWRRSSTIIDELMRVEAFLQHHVWSR